MHYTDMNWVWEPQILMVLKVIHKINKILLISVVARTFNEIHPFLSRNTKKRKRLNTQNLSIYQKEAMPQIRKRKLEKDTEKERIKEIHKEIRMERKIYFRNRDPLQQE